MEVSTSVQQCHVCFTYFSIFYVDEEVNHISLTVQVFRYVENTYWTNKYDSNSKNSAHSDKSHLKIKIK